MQASAKPERKGVVARPDSSRQKEFDADENETNKRELVSCLKNVNVRVHRTVRSKQGKLIDSPAININSTALTLGDEVSFSPKIATIDIGAQRRR